MNTLGLKVGGVPEHYNYPWRVAIEEGLFTKEKIELHWSDMSGGTGQMIKGLQTGSLDIAIVLTEGITKSILQGLEAKIIQIYVGSPLCWGVHVPYKSSFNNIADVEGYDFAISREASGSHLMSYVLAHQNSWNKSPNNFNIVGDIYGGLWALENNESQVFLWEKYTTQPFVDEKKCRRIGEVNTPWPSFVIAVRTDIINNYSEQIKKVINIINNRACKVKASKDTAENIAWRYNLDLEQVKSWLSKTHWNIKDQDLFNSVNKVVKYLKKLGLLTNSESKNWENKLFI
jgi:ABC-type nitrate/sulfonate/bicarbonate transport system substrate-binding protein